MKNKMTLIVCFLCSVLLTVSCGKISDFSFTIEEDPSTEVTYINLKSKVDETNYRLPQFSLPLYDFKKGLIVGDLRVDNTNTIHLKLDADVLDGLDSGFSWTLPNNTQVPFVLKPETKSYYFQVGSTNSRVYLALDNDHAILGLALNIASLPPTQVPGGLNAFIPFNRDQINGTIGIYLGNLPGQSGFGMFIDFAKVTGSSESKMVNYVTRPKAKTFRKVKVQTDRYLKEDNQQLY